MTESWTGLLVGGYALLIVATAVPLTTRTSRWDRRGLLLSAASALFIIAFNVGITAGSLVGGQALALLGASWLPAVAVVPVLAALVTVALGVRHEVRHTRQASRESASARLRGIDVRNPREDHESIRRAFPRR